MVQKKLTNLIRNFSSSFSSCGTRFWIGGESKRKDVKELNLLENLTGEWSIVHRRISPESSDLAVEEEKKRKFLGFPILDQNSHKFIHRNTLYIYTPFRERKKI